MIVRVEEVRVARRIAAPREAVFRAFTDSRLVPRWFSPSPGIGTEVLALDPVVGGEYRIRFTLPDGSRPIVHGTYLEVRRPESLVFTWTWEPPDPHAGVETEVEVTLGEIPGGTEVVVRHVRFPDREVRDRHETGWVATLERLATILREEP